MTSHQVRTSFMQSPLVTWVRTLLEDDCSDYSELCNGLFLYKAWLQIDPHASSLQSASEVTSLSRIKSLSALLAHIRAFYENVLDQVLVIKLPDVINIALNCNDDLVALSPDSPFYGLINSYTANTHCDDIRTFLLLILGCAVQCDQKEVFIEKIKQLDISTQHAIVECIQQITDNPDAVFLLNEWADPPTEADKDRLYSSLVGSLSRLTKERDQLYQRVIDLSCELLHLTLHPSASFSSAHSGSLKNLSLSNSSLNTSNYCDQKSHYLVELADVKSRLRRVQQELEEKSEAVVELKEVIEQNKEFCNKLRHENLELTQEARTAKAYRDEIDVLNERCRKIDRLETEVQRYRDKMNELEFFKSRVEELREDNRILGETKTMLEEQLESSRKRAEKLPGVEENILKLKTYANELNLQRELDRNQMEQLIEEIAHLRQEKKLANDELSKVQLELTDLRAQIRNESESSKVKSEAEEGNLFDQIKQDTTKRMIKLEHENQKLQNLLDDYRNNYVDLDSLNSLLDFYPTTTKDTGSSIGDKDSGESASSNGPDSGFTSNKSKMEKLNELKEHIDKLKSTQGTVKTLENVKGELEKEVTELKGKLHDEFNKFEAMERNYTQANAEIQKFQRIIESKNKKIDEYQSELTSIENENQKLAANADSLKFSLKKLNDLEMEMTNLEGDKHRLEQEKKSLDKEIGRLKASIEFKDQVIDENASKISTLELESRRLKKEIDALSQLSVKLKEAEKENKELINTVTVQKNTLTALQQDLVVEKLRAQKFADEFEKTLEAINKLCREHGLTDVAVSGAAENLSLVVSSCLQTAIDKCLQPKEATIEQLQSQLDELTHVNGEMQSLIDSLRRQLNMDEDASDKFSLNSLNELQRKIVCLEEEGKSLKVELNTQKELTTEMTVRAEHTESKLAFVSDRNTELQSENAKLQVENSLLKSQNGSLESQTADLQEQMAFIQESIDRLKLKCEEYDVTHRSLIADNESLQEIHQQLTVDYDNLTQNNGLLKQSYKALKAKNKSLEEELKAIMEKHEALLSRTNAELETLRSKAAKEQAGDSNLKEKLSALTEEHKVLSEEHKRLQTEHKMLQNIYKNLRSENNELKLRHTELQGETAECKDRMNALNVEVSKLSSYCEMVALTNNTLEAQRKKLATQSASLLSQYNDLLLDLSSGCEKAVVDKLRDLCLKRERLEKMFREYDISIEKNMPRVSSKGGQGLDDSAIYGRLWEAETPPLGHGDSHLASSAALLRQFSLNSSGGALLAEKEKKGHEHLLTPPRIPPRHHIPRLTPAHGIPHMSPTEVVFDITHQLPSGLDNKQYSINTTVSTTRSPNISLVKGPLDGHESGVGISKVQISSSGNSPQLAKASSVVNSSAAAANNSFFMRGNFKSSSVNYGNMMRRSVEPKLNGVASRHGGHHSPQLFHMPTSRNLASHLTPSPHRYQQQHSSPSVNSDSSASHESEKETDATVFNNNHATATMSSSNGNARSRILVTANGGITTAESPKSSNGPVKDSVQLSNAMNNNADAAANTAGTTGACNDGNNPNSNSNSIWYEYGCV